VNSWDEPKRQITLAKRGLDFADAELVFAGKYFTRRDERRDYGEPRFMTVGWLRERFAVVVWTLRNDWRRITSMRYGREREKERFQRYLD
jgi:uncharacterized DUF497 family protein